MFKEGPSDTAMTGFCASLDKFPRTPLGRLAAVSRFTRVTVLVSKWQPFQKLLNILSMRTLRQMQATGSRTLRSCCCPASLPACQRPGLVGLE